MLANPSARIPKYRCQRRRNGKHTAFVEIDGQRYYLGRYGTPESREAYGRTIAEWVANGHAPGANRDELTIVELINCFWKHLKS